MQDWDRLVLILVGGAVAIGTGRAGWRSWKGRNRKAALGAFLLACAAAIMPLVLVLYGG